MNRQTWVENELGCNRATASAKGTATLQQGPLARSAKYASGKIIVELDSGVEIRLPIAVVQELAGKRMADLREIVIDANGLNLLGLG